MCVLKLYKIIIFINKLFKKQNEFMPAVFYLTILVFIDSNYCV